MLLWLPGTECPGFRGPVLNMAFTEHEPVRSVQIFLCGVYKVHSPAYWEVNNLATHSFATLKLKLFIFLRRVDRI